MYLERLAVTDFRSYREADLHLRPGVTVFIGSNGLGKTNLVEALGYVSALSSHRVSQDGPLIRFGAERAIIRASLVRGVQRLSLEVEINASRANRARINRANPVRARDILGLCRSVLFAPEDLALVKGDPGVRRRFLDDLAQALSPRFAGVRADYERVLKQRNALLKSARSQGYRRNPGPEFEATLAVWDEHLAEQAARVLVARLAVVELLRPQVSRAYAALTDGSKEVQLHYRSSLAGYQDDESDDGEAVVEATGQDLSPDVVSVQEWAQRYREALETARPRELERGITLVGPHRDELALILGSAPAKGFASHGETWSFALSLRLACFYVLRQDQTTDGSDPILILDDVFAELDASRRAKLAALVAEAEQVLVTAAVEGDVPSSLRGDRVRVTALGVVEQTSADQESMDQSPVPGTEEVEPDAAEA
ncbi:DNA replication/repair protein RecF [Psychromicrobium xiongbiense]|uniref:DNA replication/repair protein RecF n=1 Tax=Psychromicrobium xiongbiense TaxID=3051184 RepID=UPI0025539E5A|nr:DNA replication/repair protein RecF [Psychromicrobium sp. YIM S02556]